MADKDNDRRIMKKRFYLGALSLLAFAASGWAAEASSSFHAVKAQTSLLLDISPLNQSAAVAVGERGHLLIFEQGSWQQQTIPTQATLTKVIQVDDTIWSVGHDAVIVKGNKEQDWTLVYQDKASQKPLLDIHFFDPLHGIAIGAYGLFLRTFDGGASWKRELHSSLLLPDDVAYLEEIRAESEEDYQYELEGILPHLNSLIATQDGSLVITGEMGLVAFSKDQGRSWQRAESFYNGSFFSAMQTPQGRLFVGGLRGNLYYSDDGTNWVQSEVDGTASINGLLALNNETIVAFCNNAVWLLSEDGGKHFQTRKLEDATLAVAGVELNQQLLAVTDKGIQPIKK